MLLGLLHYRDASMHNKAEKWLQNFDVGKHLKKETAWEDYE
jgi:hypothetical protein